MTEYYKVLNTDGSCYHGGSGIWPENTWMPQLDKSKLEPCKYGYHILEQQDLVYWLGPAIAMITLKPDERVIRDGDKSIVSTAMRGPFLSTWNERTQRLFAADCAEHVLHLFTIKYPNDDRPAKAIQAARDYANGLITREQMNAAAYATHAAYYAANAAYAAYATHAAYYAANYAAHAAYYATHAAVDDAARKWQSEQLWKYLRGELN